MPTSADLRLWPSGKGPLSLRDLDSMRPKVREDILEV